MGKVEVTQRGFEFIGFQDCNGQNCELQQSSAAFVDGEDHAPGAGAVWLGVADSDRMHLSREEVVKLVQHLNEWIERGSFDTAG